MPLEVTNMANNDLAMRFTENVYATKQQVSRELKISMIDGVWDKILSYRSLFYRYLSIKGIDKNQFRVCLCPTVSSKLNEVENKLSRALNEYNKLSPVNSDLQHFRQLYYIKCLQNIGVSSMLISDEDRIKDVINGQSREPNSELARYFSALQYISLKHVNKVDVDFFAELYSRLVGDSELTYFYREKDFEDINSSSVISRVYKSAPHVLIEQMMDGLFNFVENSNLSVVSKALIAYYYIRFVQPFNNFNKEIAVLYAKAILAHYSLGEFACFFPLETFLNENEVYVQKIFDEVQQTSDVTYFLTFGLELVDKEAGKVLDALAEYSSQIIKNDFYQLDEEPKEEFVTSTLIEEPKPEPKVEPAPVKEVVRPAPAPVAEEKKPEPKPAPAPAPQATGLAVSFIPEELDEKTAQRLERHLLELDVRLKKGQAYFYARHCTLGMFYTIEQYKKATKCVYETARTSMDKLVEFGYYEKQLVGKKFVYTPIKRK